MTETEKYEFDRQGFIILPDFLTQQEVDCLKPAIQKLEKYAKINTYQVSLLAGFLEKLRATPDGDGTLLDQSMILYGGGSSDGDQHSHMDLPLIMAIPIKPMLMAIELLGLFIKHAVLAVRLLANMVAGHLVLLGIMGIALEFANSGFAWYVAAPISIVASTLFSCLELFVALLQAYVFTFLAALFLNAAIHQH